MALFIIYLSQDNKRWMKVGHLIVFFRKGQDKRGGGERRGGEERRGEGRKHLFKLYFGR
jgi:hypothetical protein